MAMKAARRATTKTAAQPPPTKIARRRLGSMPVSGVAGSWAGAAGSLACPPEGFFFPLIAALSSLLEAERVGHQPTQGQKNAARAAGVPVARSRRAASYGFASPGAGVGEGVGV